MTQTDRLNLTLWAESDPISVEQINENFSKIDASGNTVKLLEVVTSAAVPQIDLDLSAVDWSQYVYVNVDFTLDSTNTSTNGVIRPNGTPTGSTLLVNDGEITYAVERICTFVASPKPARLQFSPLHCPDRPVTCSCVPTLRPIFGYTVITYRQLLTLSFVVAAGGGNLSAGSRITVWGVKF